MAGRTRKPRTSRIRRLAVIEMTSAEEVEAQWTQHLSHGGAYGPPGGRAQALVSLLLVGPAAVPFELPAKTVYVGADGTGYELTGYNAALKQELAEWVRVNTAPDAAEKAPTTKMPKLTRTPKS